MKPILLILLSTASLLASAQGIPNAEQRQAIQSLIDKYSQARENRDTVLLKSILLPEVDQLVSTGEWRDGISASVKGMLASSAGSPGTRALIVEKVRLVNVAAAIVDCRYEIRNPDRSVRKMWSTFVVVLVDGEWKISAIRNMLPEK